MLVVTADSAERLDCELPALKQTSPVEACFHRGYFFGTLSLNRRVFRVMLVACSAMTMAAGSVSGMSRRRGHQVAAAGSECHF